MANTARGFRYPVAADTPDIPRDIGNLAADIDAMFLQGNFAVRPVAAKVGREYYASDTGAIYLDTGTAWVLKGYTDSARLGAAQTWTATQTFNAGAGYSAIKLSGGGNDAAFVPVATSPNTADIRWGDGSGWKFGFAPLSGANAGNKVLSITDSGTISFHDPTDGQVDAAATLRRGGVGTIVIDGRLRMGGNVLQSASAMVGVVGSGDGLEWGHSNVAGFRSNIGAEVNSGRSFIAFNAAAGTSANTYKTLGNRGIVLRGDLTGGIAFTTLPTASADNQAGTDIMNLANDGYLTVSGATYGIIEVKDIGAPADVKRFRMFTDNGSTYFQTVNDAGTASSDRIVITHGGQGSINSHDGNQKFTWNIGGLSFFGAATTAKKVGYGSGVATGAYTVLGSGSTLNNVIAALTKLIEDLRNYGLIGA